MPYRVAVRSLWFHFIVRNEARENFEFFLLLYWLTEKPHDGVGMITISNHIQPWLVTLHNFFYPQVSCSQGIVKLCRHEKYKHFFWRDNVYDMTVSGVEWSLLCSWYDAFSEADIKNKIPRDALCSAKHSHKLLDGVWRTKLIFWITCGWVDGKVINNAFYVKQMITYGYDRHVMWHGNKVIYLIRELNVNIEVFQSQYLMEGENEGYGICPRCPRSRI